jgi:hypothetical protein
MKKYLTLLLAVLSLASCVPEFENPLPQASKAKIDKGILGTWYAEAESGKISQCTIAAQKSGWIEIRYIDNILDEANEPNYVPLTTCTSEIGNEKFLSVPMYALAPEGKTAHSGAYLIVNYEIEQSKLYVRPFLLDKVQHLIDTGVLKGKVEKGFPFDTVTVTSSGKEVAKAIKENGLSKFIDPNTPLILTRGMPSTDSLQKPAK